MASQGTLEWYLSKKLKSGICGGCEQNETCDRIGMPKVFPLVTYLIYYIYDWQRGIHAFPNGSTCSADSPQWFNHLLNYGLNVLNDLTRRGNNG